MNSFCRRLEPLLKRLMKPASVTPTDLGLDLIQFELITPRSSR